MVESLTTEKPFVIRGHHLVVLAQLALPGHEDLAKIARGLRDSSIADRGTLTSDSVNWEMLAVDPSDPNTDQETHWATYAYDMVGETDDHANVFENSYRNTLNTFLGLEADSPVILTATKMDNICGSCTFKQHCQLPKGPDPDADVLSLEVFEDVLAYARSNDESFDAPATRTDEGDILTNARAVRRVLAHFAIAGSFRSYVFSDALSRRQKYGHALAGPGEPKILLFYEKFGDEIVAGDHHK